MYSTTVPLRSAAMTVLATLALLAACTSPPDAVPASPVAASPGPVASPRPPFTARQTVYVGNTDHYGADFRQAPGSGSPRIRLLPDGAVLETTGREQQADERTWVEVRDSTGVAGWVIADYLSPTPPPLPTPTRISAPSAPTPTPSTAPRLPLPTVTQATVGPRPTLTLAPIAPPAQQPALAPLPPAPTEKPAPPTLPLLAPPRPTYDLPDVDAEPTRRRGGTVVPTRGPAAR